MCVYVCESVWKCVAVLESMWLCEKASEKVYAIDTMLPGGPVHYNAEPVGHGVDQQYVLLC